MNRKEVWNQYCREMRLFEAQETIDRLLTNVHAPRILDAGCGSLNHFRFKTNSQFVGIDISQEQLDRNKAFSEKILGDIQAYDLSGSNFDVIICRFVLEHLDVPNKALTNLVRALSQEGIIVMVAPNLISISGLVTKLTPHWFHVFAHRVLFRNKQTSMADHEERFPTPFRYSMTPRRIIALARSSGLKVRYFCMYEGWEMWNLMRRSKFIRVFFKTTQILVRIFTLGKCDILLGTYTLIISKV